MKLLLLFPIGCIVISGSVIPKLNRTQPIPLIPAFVIIVIIIIMVIPVVTIMLLLQGNELLQRRRRITRPAFLRFRLEK